MKYAVTRTISISATELHETFVRASGPGGQNVNKVSTAVELRFNVPACTALPDWVKHKLATLAGQRLAGNGDLIIHAGTFRTQERNRQDARERLFALIREASVPEVQRRATKATYGSQKRRLESKLQRAALKTSRRKVDD